MPRRQKLAAKQAPAHDWYLQDWMKTLQVKQADLVRRTDWSPATVNDIYHGRTPYYRELLNQVAHALHIQPYELLMHPEDAMAIRQMRQALRAIETSPRFREEQEEAPAAAAGARADG